MHFRSRPKAVELRSIGQLRAAVPTWFVEIPESSDLGTPQAREV